MIDCTEHDRASVVIESVRRKHSTPNAMLVLVDDEEFWIPHNQVHEDSEVYNGDDGTEGKLIISKWIAKQKGFTEDN